MGTVREVMVEGPSKRNSARWSGRDSGNRIVVWDIGGADTTKPTQSGDGLQPSQKIGTLLRLRITEAHPQILVGTPIGSNGSF